MKEANISYRLRNDIIANLGYADDVILLVETQMIYKDYYTVIPKTKVKQLTMKKNHHAHLKGAVVN